MNLPNRLTLARVIAIPAIVALMMIGGRVCGLTAAVLFVAASLTDYLDGHIARSRGLVTDFGKFMDPIADKLLVTAVMIMMVERALMPGWVLVVFVAREFIVSGLRLVAAGKGRVLAAGKLGKLKTATQIVAIVAVLLNNYPFSTFGFPMADILMILAAILTLWSGVDYILKCRHFLKIQ